MDVIRRYRKARSGRKRPHLVRAMVDAMTSMREEQLKNEALRRFIG